MRYIILDDNNESLNHNDIVNIHISEFDNYKEYYHSGIYKVEFNEILGLSLIFIKLTNEDEYNQYLGNSFFKINKDIILLHKNYSSSDIFEKTENPIYFTINVKSDYGLRFSYDKSKIIKVNNIEVDV